MQESVLIGYYDFAKNLHNHEQKTVIESIFNSKHAHSILSICVFVVGSFQKLYTGCNLMTNVYAHRAYWPYKIGNEALRIQSAIQAPTSWVP